MSDSNTDFGAAATHIESDPEGGGTGGGLGTNAERTRKEGELESPETLGQVGQLVGQSRLVRLLRGDGGEAEVWLAERADGGTVAVKLYRTADRERRRLFERLQTLRHPAIASPISFGTLPERMDFEVMEYFADGSLADWFARSQKPVPFEAARGILQQLHGALAVLHGHEIVHRDIKPANVLLRSQMLTIALTDFGISRHVHGDTYLTEVARTVAYAAPESHLKQIPLGPTLDWWSVGIMMLEVVRGHPFAGMSEWTVLNHVIRTGVPIPNDLPPDWKQLFRGLLTRDYHRRWGSEQVGRWLNGSRDIPDWYEGITRSEFKPYAFNGQRYADPSELAAALAHNWNNALDHLAGGHLARWFSGEIKDQSRAVELEQLSRDRELPADVRLGLALLVIDETLQTLIIAGEPVDGAWPSRHPHAAVALAHSPAPAWLQHRKLCPEVVAWTRECRNRVQELSVLGTSVPLNRIDGLMAALLVTPAAELLQQSNNHRAKFAAGLTPALEALRRKPVLTNAEAIVMLMAPPSQWDTPAQQRRRELEQAVRQLGIPTGDIAFLLDTDASAAQRAANARRSDIAFTYHPALRRLRSAANLSHAEAIALATASADLYLTRSDRRQMRVAQLLASIPVAGSALVFSLAFLIATQVPSLWHAADYRHDFLIPTAVGIGAAFLAGMLRKVELFARIKARLQSRREVWRARVYALPGAPSMQTLPLRRALLVGGAGVLWLGLGAAAWPTVLRWRALDVVRSAQQYAEDLHYDYLPIYTISAAERAIALSPNTVQVYAEAAAMARSVFKFDQARAFLQAAQSRGMASPELLREEGFVRLSEGNRREATRLFAESAKQNPVDRQTLSELGCLYLAVPDTHAEGLEVLKRADLKATTCRGAQNAKPHARRGEWGREGFLPVDGEMPMQHFGVQLGSIAPSAIVVTRDSARVDLASLGAGRPTLLEFWGMCYTSNCKNLRSQIKLLHERYGSRLQIVTVSRSGDPFGDIVEYNRRGTQWSLPSTIVLDDMGNAMAAYDVPATTYVVLLDGERKVVYTGVGPEQDLVGAVGRVFR